MSDIYINVENEIATGTCDDTITSGDVNSVTVHFTFDDVWNDTVKTAVFYTNNDTEDFYAQLLDEDDTCLVPEEVLQLPCRLFIGVFGDKDNTRITSSYVKVRIKKGTDTSLAIEIATVDLYGQIVQKLADITELASKLEATELPIGGTAGQVLSKVSDSDYDTEWVDDKSEEIEALNTELKELTESYNEHQHDHVETDYADTSKLGLTELNGIPYYKQNSNTEYTYPDSLVYKSDFESVEGTTEFEGVECVALESDTAYVGSVHDGEMGMKLRLYTNYDEVTYGENYLKMDNLISDLSLEDGISLSFRFKLTDIPYFYDYEGNSVIGLVGHLPLLSIYDNDNGYALYVTLTGNYDSKNYLRIWVKNPNSDYPWELASPSVSTSELFDNEWHKFTLFMKFAPNDNDAYTCNISASIDDLANHKTLSNLSSDSWCLALLEGIKSASNIAFGEGVSDFTCFYLGADTEREVYTRDAQDMWIKDIEIYGAELSSDDITEIDEYELNGLEEKLVLYNMLRKVEKELYAYGKTLNTNANASLYTEIDSLWEEISVIYEYIDDIYTTMNDLYTDLDERLGTLE